MSRHKGSEGSVRLTPGRGRGCGSRDCTTGSPRIDGRWAGRTAGCVGYGTSSRTTSKPGRTRPVRNAAYEAALLLRHADNKAIGERAGPSEWMRCGMRGSSRFRMSSRGSGWTGATSRTLTPIVG